MTAFIAVPTCAELGRRGLAFERTRTFVSRESGEARQQTRWEMSPAGAEEIRAAMAHNARTLAADPVLRREYEAAAFRTTNHTHGSTDV